MRRLVVLTLALAIVTGLISGSSSLFAQGEARLNFGAGVMAGFAASQVHGDATAGFNKLGLDLGSFIDVRRSNNFWGIRLEMRYIQKGSRKPANADNGDYTTWVKHLDYVEIPVLFDLNLGRYQVGAGLYGGRLLRAEENSGGAISDISENLRLWDIGGLWYGRMPLSDHAFLQMRMSSSILSLDKPADGALPGSQLRSRLQNIVAQLGVGWNFGVPATVRYELPF